MGALAAAFVWYLWKQRKGGYGNNKFQEKNIACPPMSPDKQAIGNDYAFDNPYFKDDEVDHVKQEDAEKDRLRPSTPYLERLMWKRWWFFSC
ncbi:PDZ domain-containing protein [Trichonephila clavata]|uniref:PDZ domain-containing protein n=1 Tax=Trichonephila clavata TaxID=2740835 RepID=A0A8X6HDU7_TRICU|nr:PDZ domain-containing protein [Trichonephila clavata]